MKITTQQTYKKCIEYGACVEAYIRSSIEDLKNGHATDEALAANMIRLESELIEAGVEVKSDERRVKVRERIMTEL